MILPHTRVQPGTTKGRGFWCLLLTQLCRKAWRRRGRRQTSEATGSGGGAQRERSLPSEGLTPRAAQHAGGGATLGLGAPAQQTDREAVGSKAGPRPALLLPGPARPAKRSGVTAALRRQHRGGTLSCSAAWGPDVQTSAMGGVRASRRPAAPSGPPAPLVSLARVCVCVMFET